jgi:hypothetical protein
MPKPNSACNRDLSARQGGERLRSQSRKIPALCKQAGIFFMVVDAIFLIAIDAGGVCDRGYFD